MKRITYPGQKYWFAGRAFTLASIIYLLVSNNAFAQNFHFGLKASPVISWLKPDYTNWKSEGVRMGFNYGFMTDFGFTENYSFTTGLEVATRGGQLSQPYSDPSGVYSMNVKYKLQYLDVPLTIKMKTNPIGYISYFGQFGVISSINLKARGDFNTTYAGVTTDSTNVDIKSQVVPASLGLYFGAGIEYSLAGKTSLLAGIGFNNGFTDILKNDKIAGVEYKYKANSNYLSLNVGILF